LINNLIDWSAVVMEFLSAFQIIDTSLLKKLVISI